jgi:hypothetical protein
VACRSSGLSVKWLSVKWLSVKWLSVKWPGPQRNTVFRYNIIDSIRRDYWFIA